MEGIKTYRDLYAWQAGMDTVSLVYEITADFPAEERDGLVSQMRRSAVSIPSNVAEGQDVKHTRWSLRHISTAIGSSLELETQLELAVRLGFVSRDRTKVLAESLDRVQKLLTVCGARNFRRLKVRPLVRARFYSPPFSRSCCDDN